MRGGAHGVQSCGVRGFESPDATTTHTQTQPFWHLPFQLEYPKATLDPRRTKKSPARRVQNLLGRKKSLGDGWFWIHKKGEAWNRRLECLIGKFRLSPSSIYCWVSVSPQERAPDQKNTGLAKPENHGMLRKTLNLKPCCCVFERASSYCF